MIELVDINSRKHAVHPNAIARLVESGTSGKWHGINCYVRTFDGETIEVRESVSEIVRILEAPEANPAPSVPEGWKLVPIEPTTIMKQCAGSVEVGDSDIGRVVLSWDEIESIYAAMINAAPEAKP